MAGGGKWCRAGAAITDFRVRKSIRLLAESAGTEIELDAIAREAGLSRPHFYKLFRTQTGLTPHLYLNTLLMEKALVAVSPGVGFGPMGEGFVRFALIENEHRTRQATRSIAHFLKKD